MSVPDRYFLNEIPVLSWEIVDRTTGKVVQFIERKGEDDWNRPYAVARVRWWNKGCPKRVRRTHV